MFTNELIDLAQKSNLLVDLSGFKQGYPMTIRRVPFIRATPEWGRFLTQWQIERIPVDEMLLLTGITQMHCVVGGQVLIESVIDSVSFQYVASTS